MRRRSPVPSVRKVRNGSLTRADFASGQLLDWRGDWSATTSYRTLDAVAYQGSSYVASAASTNIAPTDTTHWTLLAAQGIQGIQGIQGPPGPSTGAAGGVLTGNYPNPGLAPGAVGSSQLADGVKTFASGWKTATNPTSQTLDNTLLNTAVVDAPEITSAVINSASVQVYFTFGNGIYQLPYTSYAGGKANTIGYVLKSDGSILITRFTHDDSASVNLSTVLQYRYVITPSESGAGATAAAPARSGRTHSSVR